MSRAAKNRVWLNCHRKIGKTQEHAIISGEMRRYPDLGSTCYFGDAHAYGTVLHGEVKTRGIKCCGTPQERQWECSHTTAKSNYRAYEHE